MAKGKHINPVDAVRKAQKAKDAKKAREIRRQNRQNKTLKSGTGALEYDLKRLKEESQGAPPGSEAHQKIAELEAEIARIKDTKAQYVSEHPEQRKAIYGEDRRAEEAKDAGVPDKDLYDSKGRLRDPKRSVYYDPILNPFGVPPPGMPYKEHAIYNDDNSSSDDSDDSDESDIVMPSGPPPGEDEGDSDDDIALPDGPAPFQIGGKFTFTPPLPPGPPPGSRQPGSRQPFPAPTHAGDFPPQGAPFYPSQQQPYGGQQPPYPPQGARPPPMQPPKPSASRVLHTSSLRDLEDSPEVHALPPPSTDAPAAVISAAPQIRDLRKETTVFVPRNLKKKKAGGPAVVNAAPGNLMAGQELEKTTPGGGLMGKLSNVLGDTESGPAKDVNADYQSFLDGLGDLS